MIVALVNMKGGVGKTALSVNLAVQAQIRGHDVTLVDLDPQESTRDWADAALRANRPYVPRVICAGADLYGSDLHKELSQADMVFIDTPPSFDALVRTAMMVADLVVLPCAPSEVDIRVLKKSVLLFREALMLRPELRALVVPTRVKFNTELHRGARPAFESTGLPVSHAEIGERIVYQEAFTDHQGVSTYAPESWGDLEITNLFEELFTPRAGA